MLNRNKNKKTVFVAMSGGVDSSVAAALIKKGLFSAYGGPAGGWKVVGVFMKPWSPNGENPKSEIRPSTHAQDALSLSNGRNPKQEDCLWKQDREDALRVAAKLDIPFLTWDFSKEYEKYVAEYMIEGYRQGITPNPDVMCNKFIKFGLFLDKALELGADFIATGHYVRLRHRDANIRIHTNDTNKKIRNIRMVNSQHSHRYYQLLKAKDLNKDQSYFLYTLTQKQLSRCLFPLGDYKKDEVRKMARRFGLPNWDKKDSQGVCFVGPLKVSEFLKDRIKPQKGPVIRKSDGRILGSHDGVWYYTIGQRHGIRIARLRTSSFGNPNAPIRIENSKPYYVVDKDVKKNILYVDEKIGIRNYELQIKEFNWINGWENHLPLNCKVKIRYRQKDLDCAILKNGGALVEARIAAENILVAPGQSAVFYKRNEVIGGGIIVRLYD